VGGGAHGGEFVVGVGGGGGGRGGSVACLYPLTRREGDAAGCRVKELGDGGRGGWRTSGEQGPNVLRMKRSDKDGGSPLNPQGGAGGGANGGNDTALLRGGGGGGGQTAGGVAGTGGGEGPGKRAGGGEGAKDAADTQKKPYRHGKRLAKGSGQGVA